MFGPPSGEATLATLPQLRTACRRCLPSTRAPATPADECALPPPCLPTPQLLNFEITGGIPPTLPRLLDTLRPHMEVAGQEAGSQQA